MAVPSSESIPKTSFVKIAFRITNSDKSNVLSGLLYNSNLIPYDRETGSNWSQILNESVNGSLSGRKADLVQLVETDWDTWRAMYPETRGVSTSTGFSRTYGDYPYSDYKTNNDFFLFPTPKYFKKGTYHSSGIITMVSGYANVKINPVLFRCYY